MADPIGADLASGLLIKLVSLVTEEVIQAWNIHQQLQTMRGRLESIDALLSDAATKKLTMSAVQNWFNKLEAVAHVADALMDELVYEATRRKVEDGHKVRDFFIPSKNTLLYRFKVAHKINSIHASFDKLFKWAGDLGLQPVAHVVSVVQPREIRNTPPFEEESEIFGRDDDVSYLVQTLCKNHHEHDLPVIAIVGMGGQGKTTLARMVYNREEVIKMFPKRMWVTVSHDFDFMRILNEMVESLTSATSVLKNTQGVIYALQKNVKDERFLLVLDDVWNEESGEWEKLRNSLLGVGGARGSTILVTTRKQEVINTMKYCVPYPVKKLSEQDSWALFKQRAYSPRRDSENETFAGLGRSMVERCGGLPLAIKALGGLLHSKKSKQEWQLIKDSEMWKSKDVLPSLRLSYDNLPYSGLKRCFAYFSIFPKDSVIYKDELVHTWMALGFLSPHDDRKALAEDIGNEYFSILLWNSLLQDVERDEYGNITCCKMHDLVHDLALDVSSSYSATAMPSHDFNQLSKAKYVRLKGFKDVKAQKVEAYIDLVQALYADCTVFGLMLLNLKHLRVLVISSSILLEELPKSIGTLKNLKYLDIPSSLSLPNNITRLYNLQTLRVGPLQELPKRFCNLINLRHFVIKRNYVNNNPRTRCMFIGIERLISLQTLPHFVVSRDNNCLVEHLGGLENIRGTLELYGLGDIKSIEEAAKACLGTKSNIERLKLVWSNNENEMEEVEYNDEDVMEGLTPHPNLKELTILDFKGKNIASWIAMMTNLVRITLSDCNRCEEFPPLGHLPKLREMEICRMRDVRVIKSDFHGDVYSGSSEFSNSGPAKLVTTLYPSLTKLSLCDLPKLEEWLEPIMSTGLKDLSALVVFPKLEVLEIMSCSELRRIPSSSLPSLKKLKIRHNSMILETLSNKVSSLTELRLNDISNRDGASSSSQNINALMDKLLKQNSKSLTLLNLNDCPGLTRLTLGVAMQGLRVVNCHDLTSINVFEDSVGLKYLMIGSCPSLLEWTFVQSMRSTLVRLSLSRFSEESDEFPWPAFSSSPISFPNLSKLALIGREKVESIIPEGKLDDRLSSAFPYLTHLNIRDFEGLRALPESIARLPSLEGLHIWNCKNLRSLPTFSESHTLKFLEINGCPVLKERCTKGSGTEWFKIQHIPDIIW
ncbi:hypothetical protein DCAR_0728844 [Daucus carota subsp. sativus]|uniref:Disease resistance protein RGA3 n=2 Tax=Daucus carota subsp. sativus TaxID=79200 RepID=A0A164TVW9_DAUCS|nr:hypothetical protein DCAR_0728844 [Daucus carota subsp. sativus]